MPTIVGQVWYDGEAYRRMTRARTLAPATRAEFDAAEREYVAKTRRQVRSMPPLTVEAVQRDLGHNSDAHQRVVAEATGGSRRRRARTILDDRIRDRTGRLGSDAAESEGALTFDYAGSDVLADVETIFDEAGWIFDQYELGAGEAYGTGFGVEGRVSTGGRVGGRIWMDQPQPNTVGLLIERGVDIPIAVARPLIFRRGQPTVESRAVRYDAGVEIVDGPLRAATVERLSTGLDHGVRAVGRLRAEAQAERDAFDADNAALVEAVFAAIERDPERVRAHFLRILNGETRADPGSSRHFLELVARDPALQERFRLALVA
jgi:hypothetical protein